MFLCKILSELLGTAFLLMTVVGSGIMGDRLSGGNVAVALLANSLATGAALVVLISIFGPISGAHFNPVVTLALRVHHRMPWLYAVSYIVTQIVGAVLGVWMAHAMFDAPIFMVSTHARTGLGQWIGEFVATCGLLLTIVGCDRHHPRIVPAAVGLYITAAYWFTSSTSFANPAVTIARSVTDTFPVFCRRMSLDSLRRKSSVVSLRCCCVASYSHDRWWRDAHENRALRLRAQRRALANGCGVI